MIEAELRDQDDVTKLMSEAVEAFGGLDILVSRD